MPTLAPIVDLTDPAAAAATVRALNDRLAATPTIPRSLAEEVRELTEAIDRTGLARWEAIDPRHAVVVLRSALTAQRALDDRRSPAARDALRVALESIRQALAAIAEREPVADDRNPKEIVQWLAEHTEVPQARLAELLGVSARQLQRWLSPTETAQPEGEDARKSRLAARIVNQLRFVLTPAGTVEWFGWPRDDLGNRTPGDLLDDATQEATLVAIAGSMRASYAA